MITNENTGCSS